MSPRMSRTYVFVAFTLSRTLAISFSSFELLPLFLRRSLLICGTYTQSYHSCSFPIFQVPLAIIAGLVIIFITVIVPTLVSEVVCP